MIRFEDYQMDSASMGEENPIADIFNIEYIHAGYEVTDRVPEDEREHLGKGMIKTILPYTIQDNFDRVRKPHSFKAVVLENEYLKATFLPELGGRLWSLFDKESNKELLYVNPVFQPANLAIRTAWFSGGVEFNVGIKGHNPLTCDPMFARIAKTADGEEVLQIYEWERIRKAVYGINAYLPKGSKVLYIKDTVENLTDDDKFMYWWSNIAVPETPDTRVVVPTDISTHSLYEDGHYIVDKVSVPTVNGIDMSYPQNINRSMDFFYTIPKDSDERWIAAIEKDGVGLAQMSTLEMKGRKLFVWGQSQGGKNWGKYLSDGSSSYIEIQAGLAYTQLEHLPMKAGETWEWTEGYCGVKCDPEKVFSADWSTAVNEVSEKLHKVLEKPTFNESLQSKVPTEFVDFEVLANGSGFGALEELSKGAKISQKYDFYLDSLNEKQAGWKTLCEKGFLPKINTNEHPISYVTGAEWETRLKKSLETAGGNHWYTYYQLGVVQYALEKYDEAKVSFELSVKAEENAWGYRNLAMIAKVEKDFEAAAKLITKAIELQTDSINLYLDFAACYITAGWFEQYIKAFETLPTFAKQRGRIRLYLAVALIGIKQYRKATEIINKDFTMDDIREGEVSLSHIWMELYTEIVKLENPELTSEQARLICEQKYPLPTELDFRMH